MPEGRDSVVQIESRLGQLSTYDPSNHKISKVPDFLRGVNEEAYNPTIVAIGPIHHGKNQGMEQHKVWYLQQLLRRKAIERHSLATTGVSGADSYERPLLVTYLAKLRESEELARKYYSSSIQLPDKERFVEMLLLDGIFVIELARKWSSTELIKRSSTDLIKRSSTDLIKRSVIELARKWCCTDVIKRSSTDRIRRSSTDLIKNDYIFQYSEVHYNEVLIQIRRDLLMIENQLPFFILSQLFELTKTEGDSGDDLGLHCLLLHFFRRIIPGEPAGDDLRIQYYGVDDHLLGLVYQAYFSDINDLSSQNATKFMFHEINSTSELQEAGIQFKKAETTTLMNVRFTNGVMEIPKLEVGDVTESLFRNLIAYEQIRVDDEQTRVDDEQTHEQTRVDDEQIRVDDEQTNTPRKPRYVTEYCFLMQFLVNSTKDVEILRRAGILINWMGDDETVRLFFNKLTKNVAISQDFYYSNIIQSMNEYCDSCCNKWWSNLKRNYFNSPWSILSVLAATILLLMTAAQTGFSVYRSFIIHPTFPPA